MTRSADPLSGENDDETSTMPGAPLAAMPLVAPRVRTEATNRQKSKYLGKLKYNQRRAAEGLASAQKAVDRVETDLKAGRMPFSNDDTLFRLGQFIFQHEPTQEDFLKILRWARKNLVGRMEIREVEVPTMLYRLMQKNPEKFAKIADEIRSLE